VVGFSDLGRRPSPFLAPLAASGIFASVAVSAGAFTNAPTSESADDHVRVREQLDGPTLLPQPLLRKESDDCFGRPSVDTVQGLLPPLERHNAKGVEWHPVQQHTVEDGGHDPEGSGRLRLALLLRRFERDDVLQRHLATELPEANSSRW